MCVLVLCSIVLEIRKQYKKYIKKIGDKWGRDGQCFLGEDLKIELRYLIKMKRANTTLGNIVNEIYTTHAYPMIAGFAYATGSVFCAYALREYGFHGIATGFIIPSLMTAYGMTKIDQSFQRSGITRPPQGPDDSYAGAFFVTGLATYAALGLYLLNQQQ